MLTRDQNTARDFMRQPLTRALSLSLALCAMTLALFVRLSETPIVSAAPNVFPTISFQQITPGLSLPVHITNAGDGSNRLFIVERAGKIRIHKNGLYATDFLSITARVRSSGSEEGLLSVAFPPNYASKGWFYVYYVNLDGSKLVISRFRLTANPDVADANSEQKVLEIDHPNASNHNGGQLQFGRDGFLYLATGDGGSTPDEAQAVNSLLGKMLRINVEPGYNPNSPPAISFTSAFTLYLPLLVSGPLTPPLTYTIPISNPFTSTVSYKPEIWALGLRNPWRFSFDRSNGDLYLADVGAGTNEEVDFQPYTQTLGMNYGWPLLEGPNCVNPGCVPPVNYSPPITYYTHVFNQGNGNPTCTTVTGGYMYRGAAYPAMVGTYFYADHCSGKVWGLQSTGPSTWASQMLTDTTYSIPTFGEDESGELYLPNYGTGIIYKITSP